MNLTSFVSDWANKDGLDVIIILLLGIICIMSLNCVIKVKFLIALVGFIMIAELLNCLCDVSCTYAKIGKKIKPFILDLDSGKG